MQIDFPFLCELPLISCTDLCVCNLIYSILLLWYQVLNNMIFVLPHQSYLDH